MKQVDPVSLDGFLAKRDERVKPGLVAERFFIGTVTAVDLTQVPYVVKIQRQLEPTSDNAWYACPSFAPQVGDRVELIYVEENIAVVLWRLSRTAPYQRFRAKAHATSATTIINSGPLTAFTTIILNFADWDPNGDFNTSTYTYQPRLPGIYRFSWRVAINTTTGGPGILVASLFKNNVEVARANGWAGVAGTAYEIDVNGTDSQTMNGSTDFVNLGATQNSGANQNSLIGAADTAMLTAELVSTL